MAAILKVKLFKLKTILSNLIKDLFDGYKSEPLLDIFKAAITPSSK
jgi:hypothetical protein